IRHPVRAALARCRPSTRHRSRDDQPSRGSRLMEDAGASSGAPQIVLAFDYGTRRIGIASGDTLTRAARPLTTLQCRPDVPWEDIDRLVADYRPAQLVVGVP